MQGIVKVLRHHFFSKNVLKGKVFKEHYFKISIIYITFFKKNTIVLSIVRQMFGTNKYFYRKYYISILENFISNMIIANI
jgi:hypothetical protein